MIMSLMYVNTIVKLVVRKIGVVKVKKKHVLLQTCPPVQLLNYNEEL